MTVYQTLLDKIHHGQSPYAGFPVSQWAGTWYNDPGAARAIFERAIIRAGPGLIVEVGSFVGESTIHMAKIIKQRKLDAAILAVDTWMGGIDHWKSVPEKLRFWFGRPSLYYQFIGNVVQHGCQDVILPLSLDSLNAARLLEMLNLHPNLIYVDGSHEQGDVLRDFEAYWALLAKGGCMMVDDLTNWFPGVLHDYDTFCNAHSLKPVETEGEKAMFAKP